MNTDCPICGAWDGPFNGENANSVTRWCDECIEHFERENCADCKGEVMDETTVRVADEVFVPPFDAEFEAATEPDFDDLDD